jgi:hypothetical protein
LGKYATQLRKFQVSTVSLRHDFRVRGGLVPSIFPSLLNELRERGDVMRTADLQREALSDKVRESRSHKAPSAWTPLFLLVGGSVLASRLPTCGLCVGIGICYCVCIHVCTCECPPVCTCMCVLIIARSRKLVVDPAGLQTSELLLEHSSRVWLFECTASGQRRVRRTLLSQGTLSASSRGVLCLFVCLFVCLFLFVFLCVWFAYATSCCVCVRVCPYVRPSMAVYVHSRISLSLSSSLSILCMHPLSIIL